MFLAYCRSLEFNNATQTREEIKELCVRSVVLAEAESIDRTEVNDDNTGPASNTFHFVK